MTIQRLKELIELTHKHGVKLQAEIAHLRKTHPNGWRRKVAWKRSRLLGLKALNYRRRVELAAKEHKPAPKPPTPPKGTRFTMYDSTNIRNIPSDAKAVACYADGLYANCTEARARFPRSKHLTIAVTARHDAQCLDIEVGDASPSQAPAWVRRQHARGVKRPVVYANTSTMPYVLEALRNNGISRNQYLVWTAHYTNVPHIEPGSDATQWEDHRELYDISLCEPWFLS